jgi:hypothetical protein
MKTKNSQNSVLSSLMSIGGTTIFKNTLKNLYFKFRDSRVKDLSKLRTQNALAYMDRYDVKNLKLLVVLRTAIKHSDKAVIIKALHILKKLPFTDSKKAVCFALSNKNRDVVLTAIDALSSFSKEDTVKPLANCLCRRDQQIALAALWELAKIKSPRAMRAIEGVFELDNEELKKSAEWILKGHRKIRKAV